MSDKKHDEMKSAKEVIGEYLLKKANECFEQGGFWLVEYLRSCVTPRGDEPPADIKTAVVHVTPEGITIDDTDLVHTVVNMPLDCYIDEQFDEGHALIAVYPIDVKDGFESYNLVLKFAK